MKRILLIAFTLALFIAAPPIFAQTLSFESGKSHWDYNAFASQTGLSGLDKSSQIVNFQRFGRSSGIAFTRDALYRTDDNGANWSEIGLLKDRSQTISDAQFFNTSSGRVVLADRGKSKLDILATNDGGYSWTVVPIAIDPKDLEDADLDSPIFLATNAIPNCSLFIPFETSSNFRGQLYFRSNDCKTWELASRRIGLNKAEDEDLKPEISAQGWTLRNTGSCIGVKTGCVQETQLFFDGKEITPPQVTELATANQENATRTANRLFALPPGGTTRISLNRGFDMCNAPTAAQMQTWWNTSPLYDMNIYMSGRNRACSAQPNLSASWVNQVTAMGWGLVPTVVGYQSPCTAGTTTVKLSYDPPTAETQGRGEADIAVAAAINLGLTAGSILYYDMERYDPPSPDTLGCRGATVAFLKGWTERIKELGYKSGVYGSPKNAQEDWMNLPAASKMDAVWLANWGNTPTVWVYPSFPTFPTTEWANHQRIKQWQAPHNETWGGVTFNIDGNIADGPVAGIAIANNKTADFDGDGKSDISVYRPDSGAWFVLGSLNSTFQAVQFGVSTDIITPGDFDGDGKTDFAVFRPDSGVWFTLTKANSFGARQFGTMGDIPVQGDFNGDGKADNAVFRPSTRTWYIANSDSLGTYTFVQFGLSDDKPVPGDYDGDGKTDIAVYRPSSGVWYVLRSLDGNLAAAQFGIATDRPAQGDFDGDGKYDFAVYRNGVWYLLQTTNGFSAVQFGIDIDIPATGDFDGDGHADITVFRPSSGVWYGLKSQSGFFAAQFGLDGDRPIPAGYLPQ